jgi:hypothetical protein
MHVRPRMGGTRPYERHQPATSILVMSVAWPIDVHTRLYLVPLHPLRMQRLPCPKLQKTKLYNIALQHRSGYDRVRIDDVLNALTGGASIGLGS